MRRTVTDEIFAKADIEIGKLPEEINGSPAVGFQLADGRSGQMSFTGSDIKFVIEGVPCDISDAQLTKNEIKSVMLCSNLIADECMKKGPERLAPFWLEFSAKAGDLHAAYNLGVCYRDGLFDLEENHKKAYAWFLMGAEAGDADCMHNLACMFRDGQGVEQDSERALRLFKRAADLGSFASVFELFAMAADTGSFDNVQEKYETAQRLLKLRTKENLADPDRRRQLAQASQMLGVLAISEQPGIDMDVNEGVRLLRQAAFDGNIWSMHKLALFAFGDGSHLIDRDEAVSLLTAAAELGYADAMVDLGKYYAGGFDGVLKTDTISLCQCYVWFRRALERVNELDDNADAVDFIRFYVDDIRNKVDDDIMIEVEKLSFFTPKEFSEIQLYPDAPWNAPVDADEVQSFDEDEEEPISWA